MLSTGDLDQWASEIRSGNRVSLGKAITLVESRLPEHRLRADQLIEKISHSSAHARRIAITGVPGVGKSSFIEAFGLKLIRDFNQSVAVLAIDPSSTVSGGSILGDKTRMEALSKEKSAFIRPSPSGGHLGGVAERTMHTIMLCEAAGFDYILIETVGVGQSETEIRHMADLFLLLMLPGAGDELQGIKRGIIEMTDLMVLNKSDGNTASLAEDAVRQYSNALHFFPGRDDGWLPKVLKHSIFQPESTALVMIAVNQYFDFMAEGQKLGKMRAEQKVWWFREQVRRIWLERLYTKDGFNHQLDNLSNQILQGDLNPFQAARSLLEKVK